MSENTTEDTNTGDGIPRTDKSSLDPSLMRGALKLEVSTSTPVVSAGTEFSIYVVIRNPFPVPVTILRTETHIPVELSDEISKRNERLRTLLSQKTELDAEKQSIRRVQLRIRHFLKDVYERFRTDSGPRVAIAYSPEEQRAVARPQPYVQIMGGEAVTVGGDVVGGHKWILDFSKLTGEEMRQILYDIDEYNKGGQPPVVLQPGNSLVMHFVLKTTKWLTFTPIAHTFQIHVRYEVDKQRQIDTVPFSINIRAAMKSSLIGAIFGGVLGSIVNQRNVNLDPTSLGRVFLTSVVFAVIIVVAFARKSNVQQIVSVEDFWGGVFIGFLVGYSGESFISSILGKSG
jgi:hypothetical protein